MKSLGKFLLAKDKNAIIVAFLAALLPMFYFPTGFIAVIVVALVTLKKGPKSGFWVLSWVALPTVALLALRKIGLFDLLFVRCVAVWFFATLLHRYRTWNAVLGAITVVGILIIVGLHLTIPNLQHWWEAQLSTYLQQVITNSHWHPKMMPAEFAARLAPMVTGLISFFFASTIFAELLIARFWQSIIVKPGSFHKEFTHIETRPIFALLPCITLVLIACKVTVAIDVLPLTLFPLFIAGLSFIHFWVQQKKQLFFLLIIIYAGLLLLPALVVAMLASVAFIDTWVHFRKRVMKP